MFQLFAYFYKRCYCMCVVNAVTLYSGGSLKKTRYLIFPLVKVNILDKILARNLKRNLCSLILMFLFYFISSKWIPPFNFCLLNTDSLNMCIFSIPIKKLLEIYFHLQSMFYLYFPKFYLHA